MVSKISVTGIISMAGSWQEENNGWCLDQKQVDMEGFVLAGNTRKHCFLRVHELT